MHITRIVSQQNDEIKKINANDKKSLYRTPNNLPRGKAKLISQQTDKISQQLENWENRNVTLRKK
jgi:hypothetical protein